MQITQMLLTPNKYSRPQIPLTKITDIAVHYVGNPGSSALANRNYFENLKNTHERSVSSHLLVGLQGEIIQNIPFNEWSYCTNQANGYTISIECCHPDATGKQCPLYWSPTAFTSASVANARFADFKNRVKYFMAGTTPAAQEPAPVSSGLPYKVKVIDPALNIRQGAGIDKKIVGVITDKGTYTIVGEIKVDNTIWGILKSGAGCINVGAAYVTKIKE